MQIEKRGKSGDAVKARVLIEFEKGTLEYLILHKAQEENISIAATLKPDVQSLIYELGSALGIAEAKAKLAEVKKAVAAKATK